MKLKRLARGSQMFIQRFASLCIFCILVASFCPEATSRAQAAPSPESSWTALSVPKAPGGNVISLALAPSDALVLYSLISADAGNRLFRSQDAGLSWQERNLFQYGGEHYFDNLNVDPAHPLTLYGIGLYGLHRSLDGGDTWEKISPLGEVFAAASSEILYAGGRGDFCENGIDRYYNLSRSDDGGATWRSSSLGCLIELEQIAVLPSEPDVIYLSVLISKAPEGTLLKSIDGGLTWTSIPIPYDGARFSLLIDPGNSQKLYASGAYGIIKSTDAGETWKKISDQTMGGYLRLALSGGSLYAVMATISKTPIYRSDDGGASLWVSITMLPAGTIQLKADPGQDGRLWAGSFGYGIFVTDNGGSAWVERNMGIQTLTQINALAVSPSNPAVIYAAVDLPYPGVYKSLDGGLSWSAPQVGFADPDVTLRQDFHPYSPATLQSASAWYEPLKIFKLLVHPLHPEIAWAATAKGIYETLDGTNWTRNLSIGEASDIAVSALAPDEPYAVFYDMKYVFTAQRRCDQLPLPCSWSVKGIEPGPLLINFLWVDALNANHLLISGVLYTQTKGKAEGVFQSMDGGKNWEQTGLIDSNYALASMAVDPHNSRILMAVMSDFWNKTGQILRSMDGGATWQDWSAGAPVSFGTEWHLAMDELGTAYFGTLAGVYRRSYSQAAWQLFDAQAQGIHALVYQPGPQRMLLAAGGTNLWRMDLGAIRQTWLPMVGK